MKKIIGILLVLILLATSFVFVACDDNTTTDESYMHGHMGRYSLKRYEVYNDEKWVISTEYNGKLNGNDAQTNYINGVFDALGEMIIVSDNVIFSGTQEDVPWYSYFKDRWIGRGRASGYCSFGNKNEESNYGEVLSGGFYLIRNDKGTTDVPYTYTMKIAAKSVKLTRKVNGVDTEYWCYIELEYFKPDSYRNDFAIPEQYK